MERLSGSGALSLLLRASKDQRMNPLRARAQHTAMRTVRTLSDITTTYKHERSTALAR